MNKIKTKAPLYVIFLHIAIDALLLLAFAYLFFADSNPVLGYFFLVFFWVPLIFLFDAVILYRWSRQPLKPQLWKYFTVTRSLVALFCVYEFFDYLFSSVVSYELPDSTTIILFFAQLAIFLISSIILHLALKNKFSLFFLLTNIISLCIALYVMTGLPARDNPSPSGYLAEKVHDERVARDFQLLSQNIGETTFDLKQAIGNDIDENYSIKEENVVSRINQYNFVRTHGKEFQLCATFLLDTSNQPEEDNLGIGKAYRHKKGYQCFSFSIE